MENKNDWRLDYLNSSYEEYNDDLKFDLELLQELEEMDMVEA